MKKVAINGLGRIGRAFLKMAIDKDYLDIVAVNDLGDIDNLAYLLKYDSAYGRSNLDIKISDDKKELIINGKKISFLSEKDPLNLPWEAMEIDLVVESTGFFESFEKAKVHIDAGAKKVVITAPSKTDSPLGETILIGINEEKFKTCSISSNASCTTNASSPVIAILEEKLGIKKAILNTVHAYTASQRIVDGPDSGDWRRGRAGAANIVPSSTGAAIATAKVITSLSGKFDGIALRVPVITGSVADITFISNRPTSVEEVNKILLDASKEDRWKDLLLVSDEALVSSDIAGLPFPAIVDTKMTRVVDGDLVKVLSWYDNEMGYTQSLLIHVKKALSVI